MRSVLSILICVAVFASGCVGTESANPASIATSQAVVGAAGAVRGFVIDDTLVPVPGANVTLHGTDVRVRTGLDGQFLFPRAPPGEHQIVAEAPGFESVSKAVSVIEGETVVVELSLKRIAADVGYFTTKQLRGVLMCGVTYRQSLTNAVMGVYSVGSFLGASCNVLNSTGLDQSTLFTWLSDDLSIWRGGAAETEWTSTQAFGNGLIQDWAVIGCANNRNATFGRSMGQSPLRNVLGAFELEYRLSDLPNSSCNADDNCNLDGCHMINRIFSWPSTQPPEAQADVGITLEQTFVSYITEFFRREPPPGFTALPDA